MREPAVLTISAVMNGGVVQKGSSNLAASWQRKELIHSGGPLLVVLCRCGSHGWSLWSMRLPSMSDIRRQAVSVEAVPVGLSSTAASLR